MHAYRTHTCGELRKKDVGSLVRLSGWVNRRRDHGGLLFIDLRDHYGITQFVVEPDSAAFAGADKARAEWVLTLTGKVVARTDDTINKDMPTGEVEVHIDEVAVQGDGAGAAAAGVRRSGLSGRYQAQIPLPGPAPRAAAQEHHAALQGDLVDPPAHDRSGLHRIPNARS